MSTTFYTNPLSLFDELFDMDSKAFQKMRARAAGRFPPVNVYLDENAILVDVELPGRTAKDVSLTLESQAVVIADRPSAVDANGKPIEAPTPKWSRRLELPFRVDANKANAKFENGILRIELPKAVVENVRHIAIAE